MNQVQRTLLAAVSILLLAVGCGEDPLTATDEVRLLIDELASAAQSRDIDTLVDSIDDDYRDASSRRTEEIKRIITIELLRRQTIHLLVHKKRIVEITPQLVEADLVVAAAARPIDSASALNKINADVFVFELVFQSVRRGGWTITGAKWRPGSVLDFL